MNQMMKIFQPLLKSQPIIDVEKSMENVVMATVVVDMAGVVNPKNIVRPKKDVNPNLVFVVLNSLMVRLPPLQLLLQLLTKHPRLQRAIHLPIL